MAAQLTPKKMRKLWEEYKVVCDEKTVKRTEFSAKQGEFITATIPAPVTYTIKGFCLWIGMTEQNFYATYNQKVEFESVIACMKDECEIDAREKFENNTISSRLAGLWMSNYGYSTATKVEAEVETSKKLDDIMSQLGGEGLEE